MNNEDTKKQQQQQPQHTDDCEVLIQIGHNLLGNRRSSGHKWEWQSTSEKERDKAGFELQWVALLAALPLDKLLNF